MGESWNQVMGEKTFLSQDYKAQTQPEKKKKVKWEIW